MEYKLSPSHRRVLLQAFSHMRRAERRENEGKGHKRKRERERWARGRERSAGIGGRQTSKMKKGEGRGMKRMTMSEKKWKHCIGVVRGRVPVPRILPNMDHFWENNCAGRMCDNVPIMWLVQAGVIDPGEWHHSVCQWAGTGILVTGMPQNK